MKKMLWFVLLTGFLPVSAMAQTREETAVSKTAQGVGFSQSIDMTGYAHVSAQAVYADGTPSGHSLSVGSKSTTTIRVADAAALAEKKASVSITVSSNSTGALTGAVITLNGVTFTGGADWQVGASSAATAINIKAAIDAHPAFIASTTSAGVLIASAAVTGLTPNSWAATVSTPAITLSAALFSGGQENATISLAGVTLTQGTDFTAGASTQTAAKAISDAIMANSTLNSLFVSTWTAGTVYATSTLNGYYDYPISVSTPALVVNLNGFCCGTPSAVNLSGDYITKASHGFTTGLQALYAAGTGVSIGGLSSGTTYYAIRVDDNSYKLASSSANAVAGTAIDLTSQTPAATVSTFTVTPLTLSAGSAGFKWQGSNDNTNFTDLSVSSVTYSAAGNSLWDFATYAYKYLRLVFTGPTSGGISLYVYLFGRTN